VIADLELEREVLSAAVVGGDMDGDNESFVPLAALPVDLFFYAPHQKIYRHMLHQFDRGEVISTISLRNRQDEIGVPASDLVKVWNWNGSVPDRPGIDRHIRRLLELRAKRRIAELGEGLVDENASLEEIHGKLQQLGAIAESATPMVRARDGVQLGKRLASILDGNEPELQMIPTGLHQLDRRLDGGLGRGHMIVVGAATGGGKTLMLTNIAANALRAGHVVGYVSQELTEADMLRRLAGVLAGSVVARTMAPSARLFAVPEEIASWGQRFRMESQRLDVDQVGQFARLHARSNRKLDLLVVDHIQITPPTGNHASRQRELAHVSERLSALAKELDCAVLTGSQLTSSKGDVAMSDNTREAKDIAHNARLILEIKWPAEVKNQFDIHIAKNTMGPAGESVRVAITAGLKLMEISDDE